MVPAAAAGARCCQLAAASRVRSGHPACSPPAAGATSGAPPAASHTPHAPGRRRCQPPRLPSHGLLLLLAAAFAAPPWGPSGAAGANSGGSTYFGGDGGVSTASMLPGRMRPSTAARGVVIPTLFSTPSTITTTATSTSTTSSSTSTLLPGSTLAAAVNAAAAAGDDDVQVFLHVYARAHWRAVLEEQLHALLWSGLWDRAAAVRLYVNESPPNASAVPAPPPPPREHYHHNQLIVRLPPPAVNDTLADLSALYGPKLHVTHVWNDSSFERLTLHAIRRHVGPATRFLYMHSKGVTHAASHLPVRLWRQYMEFFLVRHWRACLCVLDRGRHDTVGVNLRLNPPWQWPAHYNGNFFWSTGAWWLQLRQVVGPGYHDPEFHLLSGMLDNRTVPRAAELASAAALNHDLYHRRMQPRLYRQVANWTTVEAAGCADEVRA